MLLLARASAATVDDAPVEPRMRLRICQRIG